MAEKDVELQLVEETVTVEVDDTVDAVHRADGSVHPSAEGAPAGKVAETVGDDTWQLIDTPSGGGASAGSFDLVASVPEHSHTNFNAVQSGGIWRRLFRDSSGAQNDEVVWRLPTSLLGGTWTFAFEFQSSSGHGIAHVAVSDDAAAWTEVTTVDMYSSSTTTKRAVNTALTVPDCTFIRLKMETKNASSSGHKARVSAINGVRTGA